MMNLIRRDAADFPRLFSQLFSEPCFNGNSLANLEEGTLPLDISEDDKNVIVRASVPGFTKEDIDVEVHSGILTIKASHNEEKEEKTERFYRRERRFGSMSRRVALPSTVSENATRAQLKDGVLTLYIPKSEEALPRKVQIRDGGEQQPTQPTPAGVTKTPKM